MNVISLATLAACGGSDSVDRSEVAAKLKSEKALEDLSNKERDCVAAVLIKYGDNDDLAEYLSGGRKLAAVQPGDGTDKKVISKDMLDCVK